ncbi:hypothetical protein B5F70_05515 [Collinsella sp. An268]|nr:hypothetical protein B5F70_05515 [Collinsella sp. An268]
MGTLEQALAWDGCPIHDTQDTGIDLVAKSREDGSWWAIQCKCHDSDKQLPKGVCDSFFARALGDPAVSRYMVMTTAKGLAKNLRQQVDNTGTMVVDTAKMAASALDIFLDQPSQVNSGGTDKLDREQIERIYRFIHDRVAELNGGLQVIVVDHTGSEAYGCADSVVDSWRDGEALVPASWLA